LWNPEKGMYVMTKVTENQTSYGNNLTSARNQMAFDYFDLVKQSNQYYYNGQ
jgi:hypothetical protein